MKVSFDVDSKQGDVYRVNRSRLFSAMYNRYIATNNIQDMMDVILEIDQDDRPLFMHLIARQCHARYVELLKAYIIEHYGK